MPSVIVTGGAGFIGANFVRFALAKTDAHIVIVDNLTYAGNLASLDGPLGDPRVTFVKADIRERAALEDIFRAYQPDAIVNFAAESHVDRSIDDPRPFVETNIVGVSVLLEVARRYLKEKKAKERDAFRFLHVSTDEVYGSLGAVGLFSEDTPYAPNSPYAASKASADHLVRAYRETYGLPALITNCSNNYGPYQYPEKLIPVVIQSCLARKQIPVYGDGMNVRDWLYVRDHVEALWQVLARGQDGETYNIGGQNEWANIRIVELICDLADELAPELGGNTRRLITFVKDRPGHDRRYAIDASKLRRTMGWLPTYTFERGIRETVQWYLGHQTWVQTVLTKRAT